MSDVAGYVTSLSAAALVCSIVCTLLKETSLKEAARFVCGLAMLCKLISPLTMLPGIKPEYSLPEFTAGADAYVAQGEQMARTALEQGISRSTQTYILDIAKSLDLTVEVEVMLSGGDPPVPVGVRLTGEASAYQKLYMQERIQQALNIPKENLIWIG